MLGSELLFARADICACEFSRRPQCTRCAKGPILEMGRLGSLMGAGSTDSTTPVFIIQDIFLSISLVSTPQNSTFLQKIGLEKGWHGSRKGAGRDANSGVRLNPFFLSHRLEGSMSEMMKLTNHRSTQAELRASALNSGALYLNEKDLVGALAFALCEQPTGFILATDLGSSSGEIT